MIVLKFFGVLALAIAAGNGAEFATKGNQSAAGAAAALVLGAGMLAIAVGWL